MVYLGYLKCVYSLFGADLHQLTPSNNLVHFKDMKTSTAFDLTGAPVVDGACLPERILAETEARLLVLMHAVCIYI